MKPLERVLISIVPCQRNFAVAQVRTSGPWNCLPSRSSGSPSSCIGARMRRRHSVASQPRCHKYAWGKMRALTWPLATARRAFTVIVADFGEYRLYWDSGRMRSLRFNVRSKITFNGRSGETSAKWHPCQPPLGATRKLSLLPGICLDSLAGRLFIRITSLFLSSASHRTLSFSPQKQIFSLHLFTQFCSLPHFASPYPPPNNCIRAR
jgi:hypothetical protein